MGAVLHASEKDGRVTLRINLRDSIMKKLAIAAAIAATVSAGAQAATYAVSSDITRVTMIVAGANVLTGEESVYGNGAYEATGFAIGGLAFDFNDDGVIDATQLTLVGSALFTGGPDVLLDFNLSAGAYVADAPDIPFEFDVGPYFVNDVIPMNAGTVFQGGLITIATDTGGTGPGGIAGMQRYADLYASTINIPFLGCGVSPIFAIGCGESGQGASGLTIGDLVGAEIGVGATFALPGVWPGLWAGSPFFEQAVGTVQLFDSQVGIYVAGDLTLTAVPVPAAAWLFGSALVGLAGIKRRK